MEIFAIGTMADCYFIGFIIGADVSFTALMTAIAGTAAAFITFNAVQKKYIGVKKKDEKIGFKEP